ncbi:MAG: hypothetical protein V4736_07330 [Bdellovibrionota bacterium]
MKTKMLINALLIVAVAGSLWSCSKGSKSEGGGNTPVASTGNPIVPPVTTPDNYGPTGPGQGYNASNWPTDGSTAVFTPVSLTMMNSWVGLHPLNDPKNYRIRVQLQKTYKYNSSGAVIAGPFYAGFVSLGYTDNGVWYDSYMDAGTGTNVTCSNCKDNGELEAKYNYFYRGSNGTIVFSGFFQDAYGAVVLTLEPETAGGADAEGGSSWKGRLFWRNFAQSVNPQSPYRKCWFIYDGPYRCDSSTVSTKASINPIANYQFLGSFTGLKKSAVIR